MPKTPRIHARRIAGIALLALLAGLAVARSWWGTRLDSFTVDEPWHIVAGAAYLRDGDYRLNPEQPPLVKLVAASAMPRSFWLPSVIAPSEKPQERELVEDTMYLHNDAALAQSRARIAMWLLNGSLLFALGLLLWRTFGLSWALGTLAFLAIEPTVGAHLPVVMTDLPVALTLSIAALCIGLLASTWRWRWALASGLAVGLALASKHSAVAGLGGLALLLVAAAIIGTRSVSLRTRGQRMAQAMCVALVAMLLLWSLYGLHFHGSPDGSDHFNRPMAGKIADLHSPAWRAGLSLADRLELAPRSYLWGLADTVRAGVEGRGLAEHLLWGHRYTGSPPWFTWPSLLAGKLPLPLIALALLGLVALPFVRWTPTTRWAMAAVSAMAFAHLLALLTSQTAYAGIRHGLPLVLALAIVSGATWSAVASRRAVPFRAAGAALLALALMLTIREPRLWEYHNELAGGSQDAWRNFSNEGVDLGQRFGELETYYRRVIQPSGERVFINMWMPDPHLKAAGMPLGSYALDVHDQNVAGDYAGYFIYATSDRLPHASVGWNPAVAMGHLRPVARFGNLEVWHGTQHMPETRAASLYNRIIEYIYRDGGQDWALVAKRLTEVQPVIPFHLGVAVERGNACLRIGDRACAIDAYRTPLLKPGDSLDPMTRRDLQAQLAALAGTSPLGSIRPLRNPWME